MKNKILSIGLCAVTVIAVALYPALRSQGAAVLPVPVTQVAPNPPPQPSPAPARIDVVFVLDTTGSMGGLIDAAKEKIWSIATSMAQARPAPEIRVGLVAYRDRGDQYVTRSFDLTTDLDSMYASLMDFRAEGGGDGPEAVNQALHDAVSGLSWSTDQSTYKVVFLVGDAPPHMDYQDEVQYPATLALARSKGIVVNTIQCGQDGSATGPWQQIAMFGAGDYLQVEQAGSAVAITTPYDEKIAALAARLDDTRLYYGNKERLAEKAHKIAATRKLETEASVAARARRAAFNVSASGVANQLGEGDLVHDVASGRVALAAIAPAELPAAVSKLAPAAQAAYIKDNAVKREVLRSEIKALSKQRADFLEQRIARDGGAKASLDRKLFDTVRAQAEKRGLHYGEDAPAY